MLKDLYEKYYFTQNYNCAETMIRAANEYYGLGLHEKEMKAYGGFGGGIQSGNTCGAVLSAVSVLSLKVIEKKAHDSANIKPVVNMLIGEYKKKYGSIMCKDIKNVCFLPEVRCRATLETSCDILESVIAEFDKKRAKEKCFY